MTIPVPAPAFPKQAAILLACLPLACHGQPNQAATLPPPEIKTLRLPPPPPNKDETIARLTVEKEKLVRELTHARLQIQELQKQVQESYPKKETDRQREHLLSLLDKLSAEKNREIQQLKTRILQLTKEESTFIIHEDKIKISEHQPAGKP
jgi:hypothetical protein